MPSIIDLEGFLRGTATGKYEKRVGSQFGSLWGWDGLLASEASPEEYAAFGGFRSRLCHGVPVLWLGLEWSVILVYRGGKLSQVNVHTDPSDKLVSNVCDWMGQVFGPAHPGNHPRDNVLSVQQRLVWVGDAGTATAVRNPTYLQLSIGRYGWFLRSLRYLGIGFQPPLTRG
jgi:hypothetical protein